MIIAIQNASRSVHAIYITLVGIMLIGLVGPWIPTSIAQPNWSLYDLNAQFDIVTNQQATGVNFLVDGIDHLTELSNWYRISGQTEETPINDLTMNIVSQTATNSNPNFDTRDDTLTLVYEELSGLFEITIVYNVTGGPVGFGQFDEDITIFNPSTTTSLDIRIFEYVDLDLYESPDNDKIQITSQTSLHQWDPLTDFFGSMEVDRYEIDTYSNTVDKLADTNVDNLNDVYPNGLGPIGPDNVTWALQWNFVGPPPGSPPGFRFRIGPLGSAHIHKEGYLQMRIIPEPASWLLAMLGGIVAFQVRRRS
jgi:hypothetical protein